MHRRVRHINPAQCGAQIALDARFITGVADGAALSSWSSRAVASISASQGTGADQPTFRASIINGRPAVEFDGTSDNMDLSAGALSLFQNAPTSTVLAVLFDTNTAGGDSIHGAVVFSSGTSATASRLVLATRSTALGFYGIGRRLDADSAVTSASAGSSGASPFIGGHHANWSAGNFTASRNGVETAASNYSSGAGNTSNTASLAAKLGAFTSASNRFPGRMSAVVAAQPAFSPPVAKRIREHLGFSFRIATH